MHAFSKFAVVAVAVLSLFSLATFAQDKDLQQILFQSANGARMAQGLKPLTWSHELAEAAEGHARRMMQQNTLSHQFPGEPGLEERAAHEGVHFSALAENVAEGPSATSIHQQWMHSPPHRKNLLDPELDTVGIAVVEHDGTLFAVEDFSAAVEVLSLSEQERQLMGPLQSLGLHLLNYTEDARRTCTMDNGFAGNHRPSFVVHYFTVDLNTLPDLLKQRIRTGHYHSAAVGACKPVGKTDFSQYRVTVMLFE